jgi:FMN-dependent NADH-azoreductase
MRLLHIDTSIQNTGSVSREMSRAAVERLKKEIPDLNVQYRDFAAQPLAHLSAPVFAAHVQNADVSGFDQAAVDDVVESRKALEEFLAADILVLGVPFYNYSVPSSLKAWIDRIVVAGKTFTYGGPNGPIGLAAGKRVIVLLARGGVFREGSPAAHNEHAETYLRSVFGLIGIHNVEFVVAEGIAIGADHRDAALRNALAAIEKLAA